MKSVEEMRESIKGLMKQLAEIKANCQTENREYDDEERKLIRTIQSRIDDLKEQLVLEEKTAALDKGLEKSQKPPPKIDPNDGVDPPYGTRARISDAPQFRSLGEQLIAVLTASAPGGYVDPRLIEERATGLGEGVGSEGGYI